MFALLLLIKLIVAIIVVVALSIITEKVSPKIAGLLTGLPTGSAITLFFIGLDNGTSFASTTAIYNIAGLVAMQILLFAYYKSTTHFKKYSLPLSALFSVVAYFVTVFVLKFIVRDMLVAVVLPLVSIIVFTFLFKEIENMKIQRPTPLSAKVLLSRAFVAAIIILVIIESAALVGPEWAGLFTAFPTTTFPLILIVHNTYGSKPVHTIIKNFPVGLVSLIAYSLTVSFAYPLFGIYLGTLAAFIAAFIVCLAIYFWHNHQGTPIFD